jgi:hypothetical protein
MLKSLPTGTDRVQGVRQEPPIEALASAPGGSDSIVRTELAGFEEK